MKFIVKPDKRAVNYCYCNNCTDCGTRCEVRCNPNLV
jgi:Cys-rich peptide (Clo7bot family)